MSDLCTEFLLEKEGAAPLTQDQLDEQGRSWFRKMWDKNIREAAPTQAQIAAARVANANTPGARSEAQRWKEFDEYQKSTVNPAMRQAFAAKGGLTGSRAETSQAVSDAARQSVEQNFRQHYGIMDAFNLRNNDYAKSYENWSRTRAAEGKGDMFDKRFYKGMAGHDIEKETKDKVNEESWGALKKWGPWVAGGALLLGGGLLAGKALSGGEQPTQQPTQRPPLGGVMDWAKNKNWGNYHG